MVNVLLQLSDTEKRAVDRLAKESRRTRKAQVHHHFASDLARTLEAEKEAKAKKES